MILSQVENSVRLTHPSFLKLKDEVAHEFRNKPRVMLNETISLSNGLNIRRLQDGTITRDEKEKIAKLVRATDEISFICDRELAQYIGLYLRPDICAAVQPIAPCGDPVTKDELKPMRKPTTFIKVTSDEHLSIVPIDLNSSGQGRFRDASFANAREPRIQLGYLIALFDDAGACYIIHYGSNRVGVLCTA